MYMYYWQQTPKFTDHMLVTVYSLYCDDKRARIWKHKTIGKSLWLIPTLESFNAAST